MNRSRTALFGITLTTAAIAASSLTTSSPAKAAPGNDRGFVSNAYMQGRIDDYLTYATQSFNPSSITNTIANAERMRRDPSFQVDLTQVTPAALSGSFAQIDGFKDTSDFTMLYLMNLYYGYRDLLPADTVAAIEQRFLAFKYWYTEPTPANTIDNRYYWSENHRIIFHTIELLTGQAFPNATFTNDGRSAAYHRDVARRRILSWIDEKIRFGFTEWHSDVYYQKDIDPLITLVEFSNDPTIRTRAAMLLDLFLTDMALHLRENNFGATHGRSYMKDKSKAADQDTYNVSKLLFDTTPNGYTSASDPAAVMFSRAKKYKLPKVIWKIARTKRPMIDKQHMGVEINPEAPVTANPIAPDGHAFDKFDSTTFWWERGAQTAWQEVATTIATLNRYDLWTSQFYAPFKPLADIVGTDMNLARTLAQSLSPQLSFALLSEVDTYTYRTGDVMLSTAQSYRPGMHGEQHHISQATLDDNAIVFTTHPKNEPVPSTRWPDGDGYFTGAGSLPRAAQHGTVSVSLYAPQFIPTPVLPAELGYIDKTHAFFPTERFDEVVQSGPWTFGRRGNGYVALYSWRATQWRTWDPTQYFTDGLTQPFDLVADGGSDNVWITEVGDTARNGSFQAFMQSITSAQIDVTQLPAANGLPGGFDVAYRSPTQGAMTFGWNAPLRVNGTSIALEGTQRFDNPFVSAPVGSKQYTIRIDGYDLALDFATNTRTTRGR